jgi:PleD family two-component response regulator
MLTGKKILVIDDSPTIKLMIKMILESVGAIYSEAGSEYGMLTKVSEHGVIVDLIIMDLVLNYEDGINLIQTLKSYDKYKEIPVIIITEKVDRNTILLARDLGVRSCIKKPITKTALLCKINEIFS